MKGITVRPDINPDRWYSTAEAVRKLEMSLTSFWRASKELPRKFQPNTYRPLYQGKVLLKFWRENLMPI